MRTVHLLIRVINVCLLLLIMYYWCSSMYQPKCIQQNESITPSSNNVEFFNVETDTPILATSKEGELTAIQLDENNILTHSDIDIQTVDVPGMIHMWGSSSAPNGWLLCNGLVCDRTNPIYERLFEAIGYTYGGSGDFFNLPNIQGRFPLGAYASKPLGRTGGEYRVTLQETHMPSHTHTLSSTGEHQHWYEIPHFVNKQGGRDGMAGGGWNGFGATTGVNGNHTHTMNPVGGGQSHENMPLYRVINFIIKL